jgi:hypothetical protein
MLEILRDPVWQSIGVLVALLVAFISGAGWYIRARRQRQEVENAFSAQVVAPISSVRRVPRHSMEEQTYQLLRAIYDLAEGNPRQWVTGEEAAERAGIPFTTQDYNPLFRYLRQSGLITTDNLIHNEVRKCTPKGIRVVEQAVAPKFHPILRIARALVTPLFGLPMVSAVSLWRRT